MKKGFSLLELMIVVVIIGILAAAGLPLYQEYVKKSRTSEAKNALGDIHTMQLAFHDDPLLCGATPRYATSLTELRWHLNGLTVGAAQVGKSPALYNYGTGTVYACASSTATDTIPVDFDKMALDHDGAPDIVIGAAGHTASSTGGCD